MRRKLSISAALSALFVAILLSCDQDENAFRPEDEDSFVSSVAGRVTDRQGRPLDGALVTATPSGVSTLSGRDGRFLLRGLVAGSYRIAVARDDYLDTMWLDSARLGLSAVQSVGTLAMRFRYAVVEGVVVDSGERVRSGAGVSVESQMSETVSGAKGTFVLSRVQPGRVRLFAALAGTGYGLLDTVVGAGDTLRGVKLRLLRRGGAIEGRVLGSDGKGIEGATVRALGGALEARTGPDGAYLLTDVPGGGSVALEISDGDVATTVTGVRVADGARTGLPDLAMISTTRTDAHVRSGVAIVFTTDSVVVLMAETVSRDSTFRAYRHLWSVDGGRTWDTTSANVRAFLPKPLGWTRGTRSVLVKSVSTDGRVSSAGIISVRVVPPPDWTPPVVARRTPESDTVFAWKDSAVSVSWSVDDDRRLGVVMIDTFRVGVEKGVARWTMDIPVGTTVVRLRAEDSSGNATCDSLRLTRKERPDTVAPRVSRLAPRADTTRAWKDSVATVSWSVSDDRRLDSVEIDGTAADVDSGRVSRRIVLQVGKNRVRLWARDSAGNVSRDTLWLTRAPHPDTTAPKVSRLAPKGDTSFVWKDSVATVSWSVDDDRRLDSVEIDGKTAEVDSGRVSRRIVLQVGKNRVRLWARDSTGNVSRDTLWLTRRPRSDTASPVVKRLAPKGDTSFAWKDSATTVSWSVSDDRRLDTVKIDGMVAKVDSGRVSRRVALQVGRTTVRLWASDSAGNVARDSLVLVRKALAAADSSLRFLEVGSGTLGPAFRSDSLRYRDTVDGVDTAIRIRAVPMDTVGGSVAVAGAGAGRSWLVRLGVPGTTTRVRVVSRGSDGDSVEYAIDVHRRFDPAYGIPWNADMEYGVLRDERDGKEYRTVRIGAQNWMAENLAHAVDSSWCPFGSQDSCGKYGRLYQWAAAMGLPPEYGTKIWNGSDSSHQGACPRGWHVPNGGEWAALVSFAESDAKVGTGNAGAALKSTAGWENGGNGMDRFGFRALGSGYRTGEDGPTGKYGYFWSSSAYTGESSWLWTLFYNYSQLYEANGEKKAGYSLRCVEDPLDTSTSLKSLAVGAGRLSPAFHPDSLVYVDSVSLRTDTFSISAEAVSRKAVVTIEGGGKAALATDSVITIDVVNGSRRRVHEIRVFHIPADSTNGFPIRKDVSHGVLHDDRDGKEYRTVRIGEQNWMAENLDFARDSSWCPGGGEDSCDRYGRLYSWSSAMGLPSSWNTASWSTGSAPVQGACPSGWHLPDSSEWSFLQSTVAADSRVPQGDVGAALKSRAGWASGNGTDLFGFRALPAGYRHASSAVGIGQNARFWTTTQVSAVASNNQVLYASMSSLNGANSAKTLGLSVRCVENPRDTSTLLSSLVVGSGALSPAFSPSRTQYADTVARSARSLSVSATAYSAKASVTIEGGGSLVTDSVIKVSVSNGGNLRVYVVRAFHRPVVDSTWGVAWNAGVSYGVLRDGRDGREYRTVRIGDQNWMAENLNHEVDSSSCAGGDADSCDKYGRLYQWTAAVGLDPAYVARDWPGGDTLRQGACPNGWHVPNDADWAKLVHSVEADSRVGSGYGAYALKAGGGWKAGTGADLFGFRVLPGGYAYFGSTYSMGDNASLWSASERSENYANKLAFSSAAAIASSYAAKGSSASLRCLENPSDTSTLLSYLSVGTGRLVPAFGATTRSYVDTVASSVARLSVTATAVSGKATVAIDGGGEVDLATDSVVTVSVTNGSNVRVYEIRVAHLDSTWGVPWNGAVSYGVLHDSRDGREYRTVRIADQNWMAENLCHKGPDSTWCYGGSADSCGKYGRLYSWTSALGFASAYDVVGWDGNDSMVRGECPAGWHLPNASEWGTLTSTVEADPRVGSGKAGVALKASRGWSSDYNGNDVFGFRLLPAGIHDYDARSEYGAGSMGEVWSASVDPATYAAGYQAFDYQSPAAFNRQQDARGKYGRSIRCIEDPADTSTSLRSLVVGQGTLHPAFLPSRLSYVDSVDPEIATLRVEARAASAKATVAVDGGGTLSLATDSVIRVRVSNGAASRVYEIGVSRRTNDSTWGVPWNGAVSYGVLHDSRDNREYRTVRIGGRNWMAENLNHARDSSWCYGGNADSCGKYGRLYTWAAAMDLDPAYAKKSLGVSAGSRRGVCPSGWHLPDDAEWTDLANSVASGVGTALKSSVGWDGAGSDAKGFRALPAGYRLGGGFGSAGTNAYFWSTTENDSAVVWTRLLVGSDPNLTRLDLGKANAFSVRCAEDLPDTSTRLRSLSLSRGTLSPAFDRDVLSYVDSVESDATTLSVSALAVSGNASVVVDGGGTVALATDSVINVEVENGGVRRIYEIHVLHRAPPVDTTWGVAWNGAVSYGVLRDARDGQEYRTVTIGSQTWMAENLNRVVDSSWCAMDSCAKYGRFYSWSAAMGISSRYDTSWWLGSSTLRQGACPDGWHVPKDSEWGTLVSEVQKDAGGTGDSAGVALRSVGWRSSYTSRDKYGFRALPAGYRSAPGYVGALFWTSSQYDWSGEPAWYRLIAAPTVATYLSGKNYGFSLRCLKN